MILVIDMNAWPDSLAYTEFILPILRCIRDPLTYLHHPPSTSTPSSPLFTPPSTPSSPLFTPPSTPSTPPPINVVHFRDLTPSHLNDADGIIFSGTPLMDNDYLEHVIEFGWLREVDVPMLGICAGMQFLALLHGSVSIPSLEIGMIPIEIVSPFPLFPSVDMSPPSTSPSSVKNTFEGYNLHRYSIEPSEQLEVLARSEHSVQAFRHRERPHFGVMFHPEVRNQVVIKNFISEFCEDFDV